MPDFDAIVGAAPPIIERAFARLPSRPLPAPWLSGYEVLIVGLSARTGLMHGTFYMRKAGEFSRYEIPPCSSAMMPWSADALGPKPLGALLEDAGIVAAMRTQAAWVRGCTQELASAAIS